MASMMLPESAAPTEASSSKHSHSAREIGALLKRFSSEVYKRGRIKRGRIKKNRFANGGKTGPRNIQDTGHVP